MSASKDTALFLSYASQDAAAAQRLAEALRAAGVEVWLDQDALVGGDAWDAKIRSQIASCGLFIPVISAATQARREGYFRIEWKLAAQRSHAFADGTPFILPVVIDATRDADALVPTEFKAVQWTRLRSVEAMPAFVARVQRLLCSAPSSVSLANSTIEADVSMRPPVPVTSSARRWPRLAVITCCAVLAALAVFLLRKPAPVPVSPAAVVLPTALPAVVPAKADPKFLAVLPFANLTTGPEGADFTDGMHDEVITALGKVSALRVISRSSVLAYADPKTRNLRQISADLGIGTVVEGTVRRAGNRVRIAVQLVDAASGRQLWGDAYERELTDVFAIQAAIAQEVARQLDATLTAGERTLLGRRPTANPHAYELYLQARRRMGDLSPGSSKEDWDRQLKLIEEVVQLSPDFAEAQALLSRVHASFFTYALFDPSEARRDRARAALDRARSLGGDTPETLGAAGFFHYACTFDYVQAETFLAAATVLAPSDSDLLFLRALNLRRLGLFAATEANARAAITVDPYSGAGRWRLLFLSQLYLRRYAKLADEGEALIARSPEMGLDLDIARHVAVARFEVDGDGARFRRSLERLPIGDGNPDNIVGRYLTALYDGDLPAAQRVLSTSALKNTQTVRLDVNALSLLGMERAMIAWLLGDLPRAAGLAGEMSEFLQHGAWHGNVAWNASSQLARASFFAGDTVNASAIADELLRDIAGKDANTELAELSRIGRLYVLMGRRDDALAILRRLLTGPNAAAISASPRLLRLDPCWSRLADDPRFDEILRNARPL